MVTVTRLDGTSIVVNAELIESLEAVPETIIALSSNKKVTVRESVAEVVERVLAYQRVVRGPFECRAGVARAATTAAAHSERGA